MNIYRIYNLFIPHFRRRRNALFHKIMRPEATNEILDVGGYHWFWSSMNCPSRITCLNLEVPETAYDTAKFSYVRGDGRCLPFGEKAFDIVFSNSVIEHVGSLDDQRKFAEEIRRVGKKYWVQTPNKWFFVEPHLITPWIHYLPPGLQKKLVRYFTIWGLVTKPSRDQVDRFLATTRLLTGKELKRLFPDGKIYRERFLLFTKSFVVYRAEKENQ